MQDKPSYLGLLNAIAVAEAEAEQFLDEWARVTPSDDVRRVISTVALREGEHAKAFAKRIGELGFELKERAPDPSRASIASSTELSDREKFEKLGLGDDPGEGPDIFAGMFGDNTIDIQTGGLLGRYIAEERDSGRMLRACYLQLCADGNGSGAADAAADDDMAAVTARLDRIEATLSTLAAKPRPKSGGKRKPAKATKRAAGKKG